MSGLMSGNVLTRDQYLRSWYTITKPDIDGPIKVSIGFDRTTAVAICNGLAIKGDYCVVGFGFPHDLIGDSDG